MAAASLALAGCTSAHRHGAGTTTSTSAPAPTTTTTPAPVYAPSPYSWDRADSAALALGGGPSATLTAVLAPQLTGGWLVFGSRSGSSGSPVATVWSSPDGHHWAASALSSGGGPSSGSPSQATAAAQYRTTTVAVGSTGQGDGAQAAVWLSPAAGQPFVAESVPASRGPSSMRLVTAGALGLFAVGSVAGRFAMWSSTSGQQWSELPDAEKVITSSPGAQVNTIIAEGDFVYAAGSVLAGSTLQAALWSTSDGINWHLVSSAGSAFSGPGGRVIYSVAPLGTGLVAVGAVNEGFGWAPSSWISPDGQSWSSPSLDFQAVPHPSASVSSLGASDGTAVRAVAAIPTLAGPSTVVAAGGGPDGQVAWRSTDGLHWTSMALPAVDAAATSWRPELVGATADTAVVADAEPGQPYMLTGSSAPTAPAAAVPTAAPGASTAGPATTWTQPSSDPAVFGPVRSDAVPVSLRLLAGRLQLTVDLVKRSQAIGPATVSSLVLTSTDGSDWTAAPAGSALVGEPATLPVRGALAAHLPIGWVAVGTAVPGPYTPVWTSPTGQVWKKVAELSGPSPLSLTINGVCTARLPAAGTTPTSARLVFAYVGAVSAASPPSAPTTGQGALPAYTVTRAAASWSSSTATAWRAGTVGSPPPPGTTASMSGCVSTGSAITGFGTAPSPSGLPQPALWRSTDATTWTRVATSGFGSAASAPLVSLADHGQTMLAVASPDPTADPTVDPTGSGALETRGPAAAAGQDGGVGPSPSVEGGEDVLWASVDGGNAWQMLDTATAPWLGAQHSEMDLVGFAPGGATPADSIPATGASDAAAQAGGTPVVVGSIDGQLAVWIGTPTPGAAVGN